MIYTAGGTHIITGKIPDLFLTFISGRGIFSVLSWWLHIFLIGLIFLPLTGKLFRNFFDKGYPFSKTIGIAVTSYLVWLASSLKILPFSRESILICFAMVISIIFISLKRLSAFWVLLKEKRKIFICEEIIFLGVLILWAFVKGLRPDINNAEKFMDYGFINSILRAKFMPPMDMWFAGEVLNYYYYGHFVSSFLTKLTGTDSAVAFNIMQAVVFSFTFSLAFSIGANLVYFLRQGRLKNALIYVSGLISAVLLTLSSNLHCFLFAYLIPLLNKTGVFLKEYGDDYKLMFWDASRFFIDKVIYEFPAYTFVISDLHAHILNLPFVLTILGILLSFIFAEPNKIPEGRSHSGSKRISCDNILLAFFLAVFYMTNAWDFPIYLTAAIAVIFYKNLINYDFCFSSVLFTLADGIKIALFSLLMVLPFIAKFNVFSRGVGFVHEHTPLYKFLVIWGHHIFYIVIFITLLLFVENKFDFSDKRKKLCIKIRDFINGLDKPDIFVLILCLCSGMLIALPEIIYVRDICEEYHRANTMFKFVYQAYVMLDLAIGYIIIRVLLKKRKIFHQWILGAIFFIPIAMSLLWIFWGLTGFNGRITPSRRWSGLNGLAFLRRESPDDLSAIRWLNANISGQGVVLESVGEDYSIYGRISMATGLQTVMGWPYHERLWRKDSEAVTRREEEVRIIYESGDLRLTREIARKYAIRYIVIGELERKLYKGLKEDKILSLGEVVFDSPKTKIIKVK